MLMRLRLWSAGLIAFAIGIPMTERAYGQAFDIVTASLDLAAAIASSAGDS